MDHFYYDFFYFLLILEPESPSPYSLSLYYKDFSNLSQLYCHLLISATHQCVHTEKPRELATIWAFCRRLKALKGDQLQSCSVRLAFSNTHSFVTHLVEFLYSPDQQWVTGGVFEINIICEERKKQLLVLFTHLQSVSDRQHLLSCSHTCWCLPDCFRD